MKADLAGQVHELMERGIRPVTMADIGARAPVRMTVRQRAAVRFRLAAGRLDLSYLATHRFSWGEVPAAFEIFSTRRDGAIKCVITVND